jgi:hypothetical protein
MCLRQALTSTCMSTTHGERDGPCRADVHTDQACALNSQSVLLKNRRDNFDSQIPYLQLDMTDLSLPPPYTTALWKHSQTLARTNTTVNTTWSRRQNCIYSKHDSEIPFNIHTLLSARSLTSSYM